eukprot:gene10495-21893_t
MSTFLIVIILLSARVHSYASEYDNFINRPQRNRRILHQYPEAIQYSKCIDRNDSSITRHAHPDETFISLEKLGSGTYGIGNMLFIYIAARALALDNNKTFIKSRQSELEVFSFDLNCKDIYIDQISPRPVFEKAGDGTRYKEFIFHPSKNYLITPYMQSYKYFNSPAARLMVYHGLQIHGTAAEQANDIINSIHMKMSRSERLVCVHVRLGDTLMYRNKDGSRRIGTKHTFQWSANKDYMTVAMRWFDRKLKLKKKKVRYLILSDTMDMIRSWNLEEFTNSTITYFDKHLYTTTLKNSSVSSSRGAETKSTSTTTTSTTLTEMAILLNNCHDLLLTSGSFGFWAGWRSKGLVLYSQMHYSNVTGGNFIPPNFYTLQPCVDNEDKHCEVKPPRDPLWNHWKP